jgi:ribonuclease D
MAKSARSSNTKRNNRNLRKKIFGPAHDARLERLSAKLQEVASKPNVTEEKAMEVDDTTQQAEEQPTQDGAEGEDAAAAQNHLLC